MFYKTTYLLLLLFAFLLSGCNEQEVAPHLIKSVEDLWKQGDNKFNGKKYKEAFALYDKAQIICEDNKMTAQLGGTLNKKARVKYMQKEYFMSIELYKASIKHFLILGDQQNLAKPYYNQAMAYRRISLNESTATLLYRAIPLYEKMQNNPMLSKSYNLMGLALKDIGKYDSALIFHHKALDIREKLNDQKRIAFSLQNIGVIYFKKEKYWQAEEYFNKALEIKIKVDSKKSLSKTYSQLGKLYFIQKEYSKSEKHLLKAFKIRKDIGFKSGYIENGTDLGNLYLAINATDNAIIYLKNALKVADKEKSEIKALKEIYKLLATAYYIKGDYNQSSIYETKAKSFDFDEDRYTSLKNLVNHQTAEKEETVNLYLRYLMEVTGLKKSALIGVIIASVLLVTLIYFLALKRAKLNLSREMEEKLKGKLFIEQDVIRNQQMELLEILNYTTLDVNDQAVRQAITQADTRVKALIFLHKTILEKVRKSEDHTVLDIGEYMGFLIKNLQYVYHVDDLKLKTGFQEGLMVREKVAAPLGLIVNELLIKLLMCSHDSFKTPELEINIKKYRKKLHLQFVSNIEGVPEDFDSALGELPESLKTEITIDNKSGFSCVLSVPL